MHSKGGNVQERMASCHVAVAVKLCTQRRACTVLQLVIIADRTTHAEYRQNAV